MSTDDPGADWERALTAFNYEDVDPQVRSIVCPLETSQSKVARVQEAIDEWQDIALRTAQLLPSFHESEWHLENSQIHRAVMRDFPDHRAHSSISRQATRHVIGVFKAWREQDCMGDSPEGDWGDADYMDLPARAVDIVENEAGYGVRLRLEPKHARDGHGHVWFHIASGEYHDRWLEQVTAEESETSHGGATIRLGGDSQAVALDLHVKTTPEVLERGGVDTWIGVDIGENRLYALAACDARSGDVKQVEVKSGRPYRHHREQLKRKRKRRKKKGDLSGVKACKGDIEKYTRHVLHTASREIVDLAAEYEKSGIRLESLSGVDDPTSGRTIGDWPFSKFRQFIEYKATEAGIPIDIHGAWFTSSLCNKCGQHTKRDPYDAHFHCEDCPEWEGDYEVNADVNAAINIARRATPPASMMGYHRGEWS